MLNDIKPATAVMQPCGAFGVLAGACGGTGSLAGELAEGRVRPAVTLGLHGAPAGKASAGFQQISQDKYTTRSNPVYTGALGPLTGREPKPV